MIWAQGAGADGGGDSVCGVVKSVDEVEDQREDDDGKNQILEFKQDNHS